MSSRLIRAGDSHAERAVSWRPAEHGSTPRSAERRPADAQAEGELQRELEVRAEAAYQQGYAAGQAAGIQQASERIEPAAAALNRIAGELASTGKRFRAEVEEDTVKLAIAIARRVLHRELATDPEAIQGLVIAAFQKLNARETHRLRLSPSDAAILEQNRARFAFPPALQVVADAAQKMLSWWLKWTKTTLISS